MIPNIYSYHVKGFESDDFQQLILEVDNFVVNIKRDNLIDIKYNNIPLSINTHTEYGVFPNVKYTAMVIYIGVE